MILIRKKPAFGEAG